VPSVLHSVNKFFTERRTLPSAALGKVLFAECPIKSTRQSRRHSTKTRILVVFLRLRRAYCTFVPVGEPLSPWPLLHALQFCLHHQLILWSSITNTWSTDNMLFIQVHVTFIPENMLHLEECIGASVASPIWEARATWLWLYILLVVTITCAGSPLYVHYHLYSCVIDYVTLVCSLPPTTSLTTLSSLTTMAYICTVIDN
jgi:hypothetical protein